MQTQTQNRERGRRAVGRQASCLESDLKELKNPEPKRRGGKRPGAGMPKGKVTQKTLDKEAINLVLREMVAREIGPMIHAQIASAKGVAYMVVREKASGRFLRVGKGRAERLSPDEEDHRGLGKGSERAGVYRLDESNDRQAGRTRPAGGDGRSDGY